MSSTSLLNKSFTWLSHLLSFVSLFIAINKLASHCIWNPIEMQWKQQLQLIASSERTSSDCAHHLLPPPSLLPLPLPPSSYLRTTTQASVSPPHPPQQFLFKYFNQIEIWGLDTQWFLAFSTRLVCPMRVFLHHPRYTEQSAKNHMHTVLSTGWFLE